jgi:hypothetical protein
MYKDFWLSFSLTLYCGEKHGAKHLKMENEAMKKTIMVDKKNI